MRRALGIRAATLAVALLWAVPPGAPRAAERPPRVPLAAYVVVDGTDGTVLAADRARDRRAVASLTKMMTALLVLRDGPLDREVVVPAEATAVGESSAGLRVGQRLTRQALLEALMVPSANDAAVALAVDVAGSQERFVARMNAAAQELGLTGTRYRTPYGLDAPGQHSSARDSVLLARELMRDPRLRRIVARRSVTVGGVTFPARNGLLRTYAGADGVKTGHTSAAGWSLAASATRDGRRIFVGALGAPDEASRDAAVAALLDWAFGRYARVPLVRRGEAFGTLRVPYTGEAVRALAGEGLRRVVRTGQDIAFRVVLPDAAPAPLRAGARLGTLAVTVDGRRVARVPLVAERAVDAPGIVDRIRWILARAGETALAPAGWW